MFVDITPRFSYGIRGNLYDWFESYLSERSQYVEFQNTQSDTKPITHGVPQGSILGPILFIIDINDFSKASEKLFSILYADDTSVFIEGYEYDKIELGGTTNAFYFLICIT